MKKRDLIIYRVVTGLFTAFMLMGVSQYFFNHEMVKGMVESIGFPGYIVYPLGIAKLLGLFAIWFVKIKPIKEWAYAGFVFVFLLAISAHLNVGDGGAVAPAIALILAMVSSIYYRKLDAVKEDE